MGVSADWLVRDLRRSAQWVHAPRSVPGDTVLGHHPNGVRWTLAPNEHPLRWTAGSSHTRRATRPPASAPVGRRSRAAGRRSPAMGQTVVMSDDDLLAEQRAFYRARAPEYDEWWQRRGRYDRGGEADRIEWNREVDASPPPSPSFAPQGDVLELAGGTGWWTERLARDRGAPHRGRRLGRRPWPSTGSGFSDPTSTMWSPTCSPGGHHGPMTWSSSPSGCRTCRGTGLASSGHWCAPAWRLTGGFFSSTAGPTRPPAGRPGPGRRRVRPGSAPPPAQRRVRVPGGQGDVRAG